MLQIEIEPLLFTLPGIENEDMNSRSISSFPCQEVGIVPDNSSDASLERLLKVNMLWLVPCPHGDDDAARKEFYCIEELGLNRFLIEYRISYDVCPQWLLGEPENLVVAPTNVSNKMQEFDLGRQNFWASLLVWCFYSCCDIVQILLLCKPLFLLSSSMPFCVEGFVSFCILQPEGLYRRKPKINHFLVVFECFLASFRWAFIPCLWGINMFVEKDSWNLCCVASDFAVTS